MKTTVAPLVPKPVQLRLKPELHQWVHQQAQRQDRSANWIINKLLSDAMTAEQNPQPGVNR